MNNDDDKITDLYHEADAPGPSKTLDETILAASRAASQKPSSARGPFSAGWTATLSIAAVIVIAVILVPVLRQQEPAQIPTPPTMDEAPLKKQVIDSSSRETDKNVLNRKTRFDTSPAALSAESLQPETAADYASPVAGSPGAESGAATTPSAAAISLPRTERKHESAEMDTGYSSMEAADSAPFAIHTPEMWEVKISRLIEEGRHEDAKKEIQKLIQHHPEHEIDKTLMEQLDENDE
jgi:hypothetical protein